MLNWWEHRGCRRGQTCTWQPAPERSWSSVRIVSCGRTGPVATEIVQQQRKIQTKKTKAKQRRPKSACAVSVRARTSPAHCHDWPNCAPVSIPKRPRARAEGGDCPSSTDQTGEIYGGRAVSTFGRGRRRSFRNGTGAVWPIMAWAGLVRARN